MEIDLVIGIWCVTSLYHIRYAKTDRLRMYPFCTRNNENDNRNIPYMVRIDELGVADSDEIDNRFNANYN